MRFAAATLALCACRARFDESRPDARNLDAPGVPVPIAFVQGKAAFVQSPLASMSLQLDSSVAIHDALVLVMFVADTNATVTSITDTVGNTFTLSPPTDASGARFYFAFAADAHAGFDVVTVTMDRIPASHAEVIIDEYSGIALSSALDNWAYNTGTYSGVPTMFSTPLTTTQEGELVFGYATGQCVSAGAGFSQRSAVNGDATEDAVVGIGTYQTVADIGCPTTGSPWQMLIALFRPQTEP